MYQSFIHQMSAGLFLNFNRDRQVATNSLACGYFPRSHRVCSQTWDCWIRSVWDFRRFCHLTPPPTPGRPVGTCSLQPHGRVVWLRLGLLPIGLRNGILVQLSFWLIEINHLFTFQEHLYFFPSTVCQVLCLFFSLGSWSFSFWFYWCSLSAVGRWDRCLRYDCNFPQHVIFYLRCRSPSNIESLNFLCRKIYQYFLSWLFGFYIKIRKAFSYCRVLKEFTRRR